MTAPNRLAPALVIVAALCISGAVRAAEPEVIATSAGAAGSVTPSVADQIDAYLKSSPAASLPKDGAPGVTSSGEARQVHGMVDVAVGSNGYRSAFVQSDLPLGKTSTLSIAVGETHFNGRFGAGAVDRQSIGLGLFLGDAAPDPHDWRCHQTGEDGSDVRPDSQLEGGRPRPCHAAGTSTSPQ